MEKEKDILFLCQYFYPEYISSATLPFDTALAISKAGYKVGAICGYPKEYNLNNGVPLKETHRNIEIKRLKYLQFKRSNFIGRIINYFSFTLSVALRFFDLRKYKIIIVYSNPPILPLIAALAKRIFKTKIVFVSYDVYPEMAYITKTISENSIISRMMKVINRNVFKQIDKVVALSNEMKDYLLKHRPTLLNNQVEVIPNWYEDKGPINNDQYSDNKLFSSFKQESDLIVSYFGNMGIAQDLETIIDAIRQLRNEKRIKFLFAGHGNKMWKLKSIVENENLENVSILNFLHGNDFQAALSISDCFIVSLADGLTGLAVPSKTYSYMMAGKPVIAIIGKNSDIAKDLNENNAGFAMEVGESSKLVSAIKELLNNKEKRELMGRNCRKVFLEKYTTEFCTQQYVKMIGNLLEEN
jgi:glycosyltransferase involved in cell wall biosynthesis